MSANGARAERKRIQFYDQGQVFALPVDDWWALGLISRVSKKIPSLFLGHFFPYLWKNRPEIHQLPQVAATDAVYVRRVSHLAVVKHDWPILGRVVDWSPADWPMPHFGISPQPPATIWREEVYDEMDPGAFLRTVQSSDPEAARMLPRSGSAGAISAQKQVARILRGVGTFSVAPAPKGIYELTGSTPARASTPEDQGVDLHYRFETSRGPIDSRQGRQIVEELETALMGVVRVPDEVDGVEFGAADGVIFLRGPDAGRLWIAVESLARVCPLRPAHAILRRADESSDGVVGKERIDL